MPTEFPTGQKIRLLIEAAQPMNGAQISTAADIARLTGISHQTLMNLLQGQNTNPRLDTLRALCELYGISLDYFDCENDVDCRAHILQKATINRNSMVSEIIEHTEQLSATSKQRVLRLMEWMQLGMRAELAQQQRKSH